MSGRWWTWPGHAWLTVPARWYIGGVFVTAAVHKIAAPHSFAVDVATYAILPLALVNLIAIVLPWIEVAAGGLLLTGVRARAAALLTTGMMLVFLCALSSALVRHLDMSCGCFASTGLAEDPISWKTVARDLVWLALSVYVVAFDRGRLGLEGWWRRAPFAAGVALVAFLASWGDGAAAQTPTCESLPSSRKVLARTILAREHLYDCCDDTIAACLDRRPVCSLAQRLSENVCRRIAAGQPEREISAALSRRARSMLGTGAPVQFDLAGTPAAGVPLAPVNAVLFACARCRLCARLTPELAAAVAPGGALHGKVRLHVKLFPIRGHEHATEAALELVAAYRLDAFWPLALRSFEDFDAYSPQTLPARARAAGLDVQALSRLVADPATRELLVSWKKEGIRNGVDVTPAVFIDGRRWVGDVTADELLDALTEEWERATGRQVGSQGEPGQGLIVKATSARGTCNGTPARGWRRDRSRSTGSVPHRTTPQCGCSPKPRETPRNPA